MEKIRWIAIQLPISIKEIANEMLKHPFSNTSESGFILKNISKNLIEGKFIQQRLIINELEDPFGNITEEKKKSYIIIQFKITNDIIGLELINPPRALQIFISKLYQLIGLGLILTEIKIDPLVWIEFLEHRIGKTQLVSINASGINVKNKGLAKVCLTGKKDIRNEFKQFVGHKKYIIEDVKSKIMVQEIGVNHTIELYKNGSMKVISKYPIDDIKKYLKEYLIEHNQF